MWKNFKARSTYSLIIIVIFFIIFVVILIILIFIIIEVIFKIVITFVIVTILQGLAGEVVDGVGDDLLFEFFA